MAGAQSVDELRQRARDSRRRLGGRFGDADLERAKGLVVELRDAREYELMGQLAEAVSRIDPKDVINRRIHAQCLIETGKATVAIELLKPLSRRLAAAHPEFAETAGLLGRAYKLIFCDAGDKTSAAACHALKQAIAMYRAPLAHDPDGHTWHWWRCRPRRPRAEQERPAWPGVCDQRGIFGTGSMAPRSFWKGYLKLSLVTCPVAMMPAVSEGERVRFHTLNRATGNRIQSRYVDAETGEPVDEDDEVKGYPSGPDQYVPLEEDELESVALESTRTIDIEQFVPRDSIGWVWYDRPHYLVPDDAVGEEAFSVIRDAMAATDMAGIARLVLYRRERAVMLVPHDKGIVLWTLRYGDEVRDPGAYFDDIGEAKVDPKLKALIGRLIEERTKPWDPQMVTDPVQEELLRVIAAKKRGKRPAKPRKAAEPTGNVVSIMDALKRSIRSEAKGKTR